MPDAIHNHLIRALSAESLDRIKPLLRLVPLEQGQAIDRTDAPVTHVYLVNQGYVSMVKRMRDGRSVEVGGIGVEGLTAPSAVLGQHAGAVLDSVVQIPGSAFRIERAQLQREMEKDSRLRQAVTDYVRFLIGQIAQTAACNRLHSIEKRCSRWLLIAHDNALNDRFILTHEYLAMMLGGQRAGVSMAAHRLKESGLIDYARGVVTITDRSGLEQAACECYRASRQEMRRLYGNLAAG